MRLWIAEGMILEKEEYDNVALIVVVFSYSRGTPTSVVTSSGVAILRNEAGYRMGVESVDIQNKRLAVPVGRRSHVGITHFGDQSQPLLSTHPNHPPSSVYVLS